MDRFVVIEKLLCVLALCYRPLTRGSLPEPRFLHRVRTWTAGISLGRTKRTPSRSRQKIRPASNRRSCLQCRSQNITTPETPAVAQRTERICPRHLHYRPSAGRSRASSRFREIAALCAATGYLQTDKSFTGQYNRDCVSDRADLPCILTTLSALQYNFRHFGSRLS